MKPKKKFKFENLIGGQLLLLLGEDLDERAESFAKREIYTLPSQNRGVVDAMVLNISVGSIIHTHSCQLLT